MGAADLDPIRALTRARPRDPDQACAESICGDGDLCGCQIQGITDMGESQRPAVDVFGDLRRYRSSAKHSTSSMKKYCSTQLCPTLVCRFILHAGWCGKNIFVRKK